MYFSHRYGTGFRGNKIAYIAEYTDHKFVETPIKTYKDGQWDNNLSLFLNIGLVRWLIRKKFKQDADIWFFGDNFLFLKTYVEIFKCEQIVSLGY